MRNCLGLWGDMLFVTFVTPPRGRGSGRRVLEAQGQELRGHEAVQLQKCTPFVLADSMPGRRSPTENGVRFATTPGAFGRQEDQDEAAGFATPNDHDVLLDRLDLPLWFQSGVNSLDVFPVARRGTSTPDADQRHVGLRARRRSRVGALAALRPRLVRGRGHGQRGSHRLGDSSAVCSPCRRYWVYISVPEPASAIAWMGTVPWIHGTRSVR